jgi:hypothetical protein
VGSRRAPHEPLLVLRLLGRYAADGSTVVTYDEAEFPLSRMINDFGPAATSRARARQRVAMPFVHLERNLWDLRDYHGAAIGPDASERGTWLRARGAHGRSHPEIELLLADPGTFASSVRLLLDQQQIIDVVRRAKGPVTVKQVCAELGIPLEPARSEALRAKLKRLAQRGRLSKRPDGKSTATG